MYICQILCLKEYQTFDIYWQFIVINIYNESCLWIRFVLFLAYQYNLEYVILLVQNFLSCI